MQMNDITPTKGMGATKILHSDRQAYTVVAAYDKYCVVQRDWARRKDNNGQSDAQEYAFMEDLDGELCILRKRTNGQWREVETNQLFIIGSRSEFYDYSF
jgi:hypothetical protein